MPEIQELVAIVKQSAREILVPEFGKVQANTKADGSLVTPADLAMNKNIRDTLTDRWPEIAFISEEMSQEEQRALFKVRTPLWVLDPLDGTTNFVNSIPFFAVSLALIEEGNVRFGIVYDPLRDECFTAEAGRPAQLNNVDIVQPSVPESLKNTVANIDFKRLPQELRIKIIEQLPYKSQRSFGSAALEWCWLAMGRGHVYLHGRQNVWDFVAGQMILQHAHGQCCTLEGTAVFDRSFSPNSAVAAATPELFRQWCDWLEIPL